MKNITPKLTLVGAGPGDPDLITVKGLKALSAANVVLYDALVDVRLLDYAPTAKKIFVGKRKGYHRYTQAQINKLIVEYALSFGNVVRLKGGDPFVFGRGAEEIAYAENFGIATEVISGITSAVAVPAACGIALTKREVAESFWVLTGTTTSQQLSQDIYLAAQSTATVVILMGMSKLDQIVSIFQEATKGELPVGIIQNGTTPQEKIAVGTVNTILGEVERQKISSPAVIVMGEIVKTSVKLRQFYDQFNLLHH